MRVLMRRLVLAAFVSLVLLLVPATAALGWPDVGAEDLAPYGLTQADLEGMSEGYPDGTWKPYDQMSRGQFVKMAVEAWDIPLLSPDAPSYADVPRDNAFYPYIEAAAAANLVTGTGGGYFDPFGTLTREQAAAVIARWIARTDGYTLSTYFAASEITALLGGFGDGREVSTSLQQEVTFAIDWQIMLGTADNYLRPHAGLWRIQGAALLVRGAQRAAANGLTANSIVLGMGGATGSFSGDEEDLGFQLAFQEANHSGGIHGRQVTVISYPGAVTTADKVANAKKLIEEDKVFGIVNFGGMPLALALAPYVQQERVPYLFPHTGAGAIHGLRYVFTSFPFYEDECRYMLKYLVNERGYRTRFKDLAAQRHRIDHFDRPKVEGFVGDLDPVGAGLVEMAAFADHVLGLVGDDEGEDLVLVGWAGRHLEVRHQFGNGIGHSLRCGRLRSGDSVAIRRELSGLEVDEGALNPGAANIDSKSEVFCHGGSLTLDLQVRG